MLAVLIVIWAVASATEGACWALPEGEPDQQFCFHHARIDRFRFACYQYVICNGCGIKYGAGRTVCNDMYNLTLKSIFCLMFDDQYQRTDIPQCIKEGEELFRDFQQFVWYEASPRRFCSERWVAACFYYY